MRRRSRLLFWSRRVPEARSEKIRRGSRSEIRVRVIWRAYGTRATHGLLTQHCRAGLTYGGPTALAARRHYRQATAPFLYNEKFHRGENPNHAPLVTTLYSHAARGAGRRRGRQPQIPGARWLHPPTGCRVVLVPVTGTAVEAEDHPDRPRRDGQDRAGVLPAGVEPARAVAIERPLGGDGRQHVPPEGPRRARA